MSITNDFEYYCPSSLDETVKLLEQLGEKAALLAGGTDLIVNIKDDLESPSAVIDIKRVSELRGLDIDEDKLFIGAKTTFTDILDSSAIKDDYLLLWESARAVASVGIRNRATLVGNICSAVPCMDSAPALLCYDAVVHTVSKSGKRDIPINDWFIAPRKTAREADELVVGVTVPLPSQKNSGCYIKLGRYGGEDLAQAGLGILIRADLEYRISFTAVGPIPIRAKKLEELLKGKEIDQDLLKKAKDIVAEEISPITDIRSTCEYREHICRVMLERGLIVCQQRMNGEIVDTVRILGG